MSQILGVWEAEIRYMKGPNANSERSRTDFRFSISRRSFSDLLDIELPPPILLKSGDICYVYELRVNYSVQTFKPNGQNTPKEAVGVPRKSWGFPGASREVAGVFFRSC